MAPEDIAFRLAYLVMLLTLALMSWAVYVQADGSGGLSGVRNTLQSSSNPAESCPFNRLCFCSKPGPIDYGIVSCRNVPFFNIPTALNSSRAFSLTMEQNVLKVLGGKSLVNTGLRRLQIRRNGLSYIADDAFFGLSKFLTELDLQDNALTQIPTKSLARLVKLRTLNLKGNRITEVGQEDFEGIQENVSYLSIANNLITLLPESAFSLFPNLEQLDLSFNSIKEIHSHAFLPAFGPESLLTSLSLKSNLLREIPFEAVSSLKLHDLDLSENLITSLNDSSFQGKLTIFGELNLSFNQIRSVPSFSLQNFRKLSSLVVAYNPIEDLGETTFKGASAESLDISHCQLYSVDIGTFKGMEKTLKKLDLSFNNLTGLHPRVFSGLNALQELTLDETRIGLDLQDLQESLVKLSLLGENEKTPLPLQDLAQLYSIRGINLSSVGGLKMLTAKTFEGFGSSINQFKISHSKVNIILDGAFAPLVGITSLDLSDNRINRLGEGAFDDVGHSLQTLNLNNGLTKIQTLRPALLQRLTNIRTLDLGSNGIVSLEATSFHHSPKLRDLNLRFNKLSFLPQRLFDAQKIPVLRHLALGFNLISNIEEGTFSKLNNLERLELNDNMIEVVRHLSFQDLPSLKHIALAGNRISVIEEEAFDNIPNLEVLDLSYNEMTSFTFLMLENVGILSGHFKLDLSFNKLSALGLSPLTNSTIVFEEKYHDHDHEDAFLTPFSTSSIATLDLSSNNISFIEPHFFSTVALSLRSLNLRNNRLSNLTHSHFSSMTFLQELVVGNVLDTLEYDTFRDARSIQIVRLDDNVLKDVPPDLFEGCGDLRVVSMSGNRIRSLGDSLFKNTRLEFLSLSGNAFARFPETVLCPVSSTLVHLDLSRNEISSLNPVSSCQFHYLRVLSFANNRILSLANNAFSSFKSLTDLDLSGNPIGHLAITEFLAPLKETILTINLTNISLTALPEFDGFQRLLTFNISHNYLQVFPTFIGTNTSVSNLRILDLSYNSISNAPPKGIWENVPRLISLNISNNLISQLANESFQHLEGLQDLDVSYLPLESLEKGTLSPLETLKKVTLGPIMESVGNAGSLIHPLDSLSHLHLVTEEATLSSTFLLYQNPPNLKKITISGKELVTISDNAFQSFSSRMHFTLEGTSLMEVAPFQRSFPGTTTTYLTLEVGSNNPYLQVIGNPMNKGFNERPESTYLESLILPPHSSLSCSCDSGWIEFWLRNWMQKTCPLDGSGRGQETCDKYLQNLRSVNCSDKVDLNLARAFVEELECGDTFSRGYWEIKPSCNHTKVLLMIVLSVLLLT